MKRVSTYRSVTTCRKYNFGYEEKEENSGNGGRKEFRKMAPDIIYGKGKKIQRKSEGEEEWKMKR
jgi:hypothetical protein